MWIHGGGLTQDGARNYDGSKLAADGTVVVTINYRLGALGFLAHPALASRPGGPAGNYGLMDQQAALRWVQRNIAQFGGDPHNVTIAGQSAGGLSVLAQLVSPGARGLFQRAIVQSGAFALTQQPLAAAEAAGEKFATAVGCADQTAQCLRSVPVSDLVSDFGVEIPGVVDGSVLTQSIGTAIAHGQFARVPILNGITHDEELIFVAGLGIAVSQRDEHPAGRPAGDPGELPGQHRPGPGRVRTRAPRRSRPSTRSAPTRRTWPSAARLGRELRVPGPASRPLDRRARRSDVRLPVQRRQRAGEHRWVHGAAAMATHGTELPYLFDQPNAPFPAVLNADQQALAASMRAAWANFAASGNPSSRALPWPSFANGAQVMSLVPPQPQVETDFATAHHCSFWAAG